METNGYGHCDSEQAFVAMCTVIVDYCKVYKNRLVQF